MPIPGPMLCGNILNILYRIVPCNLSRFNLYVVTKLCPEWPNIKSFYGKYSCSWCIVTCLFNSTNQIASAIA